MSYKILSKEELITELETQIDLAEKYQRDIKNMMEEVVANLKNLRHNQKYGEEHHEQSETK